MALINIEYGSLASSETVNKNFTYLDEKIAESNESIMTSISSILSNIATINARINDISENMNDSVENLNSVVEDYKSKTKLLVNKATMVPNWSSCTSITLTSGKKYTAPANGYVLIVSETISEGKVTVNSKSVVVKVINGQYDNAAELLVIPVASGDVVTTTLDVDYAYFLPAKDVAVSGF